jgi:arylsulfatase A-like enzyme
MSRALCLVVVVLLAVSLPAEDRPNVLFLVSDDLNCDLGCYGHPQVKTPNIDKLAARGVRFERAYCQFPLCSPSRTSFLTGRRPNATKILTNPRAGRVPADYTGTPHFREFIPDTVTMPELFRQNGYFVARVGKLYHYGVPGQIGTSGLDDPKSWEQVVNPIGRDKKEESQIFTFTPGSYGGTLSWMAADGTDEEQTDGLGATAAIELLEKNKDKPFFLGMGFYRPHTPYVAPKKYFAMYPKEKITLPQLSEEDKARRPAPAFASAKAEQETMTDDQRREAIQAYWASITFMDAQVGRVLDALNRLGLAEKTIVVFASDHGYHLADHGLWQKQSVFERSARVPLVIAAPGATANGKATTALAELVDIYPTLADLCGLKAPAYLDGMSQRPVLENATKWVKGAAFTQVQRGMFPGYSVRSGKWRYMLWDGGKKGEQLYDLENDPAETTNLAADPKHAEVVKELKAKIEQVLSRT